MAWSTCKQLWHAPHPPVVLNLVLSVRPSPSHHTQLAKLAGCHVVATAGGPSKVQLLKKLGADRVIDYKSEQLKVSKGEGGVANSY
jgi:hypothetical protein